MILKVTYVFSMIYIVYGFRMILKIIFGFRMIIKVYVGFV
jgi:hypothetical protein